MGEELKLDISSEQLLIVQGILKKYLYNHNEVRAFGSRVKGTATKKSDLDLAIVSDKTLSISLLADLENAFSESDLPFKVDVVDWFAASDSFKKIIENGFVVVKSD